MLLKQLRFSQIGELPDNFEHFENNFGSIGEILDQITGLGQRT